MQDKSPMNDPRLEAVAQQLAAALPRLAANERDALLYECGFAAGRQSTVRVARWWRAAAASLALAAIGLGVLSTSSLPSPRASQVVSVPEAVAERSATGEPAGDRFRQDNPRPGVLLAGSSWEQVRASLESPPRTVEVFVIPAAPPRRAELSARSAWNDPELSP
jgi:hypothetical protein